MTLNPKKIYEDLKRKDIDISAVVDSLIYLIGNDDNFEVRFESIKILREIGFKSDKVFSILENLLVSDPNQEIRELAVTCLKALFQEKALSPFKWALDYEKSWRILMLIISCILEINNNEAKSVLIKKIKKFDKHKFNKSLIALFKTKKIQNFKTRELVEIIINYITVNYFEGVLKEVKYQIDKGLVVELDLSFTSNDTFGWKVLNNLSEFMKGLTHLKRLELQSNKLGKVPDSIFSLFFLKHLDLSHNEINKLPDSFHSLKSLEFLNLRYNHLSEIPNSISSLTKLKVLDLKHNKLTILPLSFGELTSLEDLNLHGNQLNTLPSSLEGLVSLEKLNLGLNGLKSVPIWIRNLRSLKNLGLGGNKYLSKIEEWISLLPPIKELNLYDNDISELPESIGSLDSLEVLIIPNNHLVSLPESFKKLIFLKKLDLSWNDITDIPEWISSLSALQELNLRGNKLLKLPESISSIQSLRKLNVSLNKDIIQIPNDLENKGLQIIK